MLKHYIRFICQNNLYLQKISTVTFSTQKEKWDLFGAVCVERKPVLTQELNSFENKFAKYLNEMEFRKSMKSKHEIRHEQDMSYLELIKKGTTDIDLDATVKQTAQDFEDACADELSKFKFADCITEADKKNDKTSLERKLRNHLILLVEQQIGKKNHFILPQVIREDGETMRQTAERALKEYCGENLKVTFFGNAPAGFYKYRYPKDLVNGVIGAKIFIYIVKHVDGQVDKKGIKYKWLDRQELEKEIPDKYFDSINKFLIDESVVEKEIQK